MSTPPKLTYGHGSHLPLPLHQVCCAKQVTAPVHGSGCLCKTNKLLTGKWCDLVEVVKLWWLLTWGVILVFLDGGILRQVHIRQTRGVGWCAMHAATHIQRCSWWPRAGFMMASDMPFLQVHRLRIFHPVAFVISRSNIRHRDWCNSRHMTWINNQCWPAV